MCFFFSFIPMTIFVVIGYFVLFSSTKTEGPVRKFGQILSIWIFLIAAFFPTMGAFVTLSGLCPFSTLFQSMN